MKIFSFKNRIPMKKYKDFQPHVSTVSITFLHNCQANDIISFEQTALFVPKFGNNIDQTCPTF